MPSKKRATPVSLQPLDALFGTNEESINGISEIAIGSLHPFPNHPFQVRDDKKMEELSESIIQYGVLVPGIVRLRESGGYELVAGHRRKRACELAGLEKMPVIIKDLTDDESTVIMVDSNIQREELLISEKAFAYKMKYEALKRQGKRSDLTSCQVGKKLAAEEVSQNTEDSSRQILRYIHLTLLLPELLEMADDKKLPFNTAVEISYLRNEEQQVLLQYMEHADRIFTGILLSFDLRDLLVGVTVAVILKLLVWQKQSDAKKLRKGIEYGSARWGTAEDIKAGKR